MSAAGKDLVAIVNASRQVRPGDDISLTLPLDKLHLFDAETGISVIQLLGDMPSTDVGGMTADRAAETKAAAPAAAAGRCGR